MRRPLLLIVLLSAGMVIGAGFVAETRTLGQQQNGSYIVSSGQTLTPVGDLQLLKLARPKDLAISPDGSAMAVLATDGIHFFGVDGKPSGFVAGPGGPQGIIWSSQDILFASESDGKVGMLTRSGGEWNRTNLAIDIPNGKGNPQATGLAVAGNKLYVALGIRDAIAEYDLNSREVTRWAKTDAAPYELILDKSGSALYVSCRGGAVTAADDPDAERATASYVHVDPQTDAVASGSVMKISLSDFSTDSVGTGRQPDGLLDSGDGVLAAMNDSDLIQRIGTKDVSLMRPAEDAHFGQIPTSICESPDGAHLYVALGGANAIAVCDPKSLKVQGYVPTAWFPIKVAVVGGNLVVACAKGLGARTANDAAKPEFYIHNSVGVVEFIPLHAMTDLRRWTAMVAKNNAWGQELPPRSEQSPKPIPDRIGEPSVFKHVVYIIKENQTYDSVFGDMREGNGRSDLCLYPEFVSPNQHELAREFVLLDNTYVSGTNSADGHQWTDSAVANGYMEHNYNAYARSYPYDGGDPLAFSPEGFLWTAAVKAGKSVRVFGEFVDKPVVKDRVTGKAGSAKEIWRDYKAGTGRFDIHAETSQKALKPLLNPTYIGFPNTVSDQWRADQFLKEFRDWQTAGSMPNLVMMLLPCDHTGGFQTDFPTPWAAVADNDLALGRIVEAISSSKFWKDTLILVIEDDGQAAVDHVDGHRVPAQVISPYTRRGLTVSQMYTTVSFVRTIGLVLGMPAMTRFDRSANPLTECFADKPDFTPYNVRPNKVPLDQFTPAPEKLKGEARELAMEAKKQDWSQVDRANPEIVARSAWLFVHPDKPFPSALFHPDPAGDPDGDGG